MHKKIISEAALFKGLNEKELEYALNFFSAKEFSYKKGEILNTITKKMDFFGLVLEGVVQVYMDDIDGNQVIMANNGPGESFGESLCYLGQEAPVYILASTDAVILKMKTDKLHAVSKNELELELHDRFTSILAERTLMMNNRIQILSKISIRDKLLTFFAQYPAMKSGEEITLPFDRNDMAIFLGVNRSALSRELSAMQSEGIIKFHKNKFRLMI